MPQVTHHFKRGDRVRYTGKAEWAQGVTGTVTKIYGPPAQSHCAAAIKVDELPANWPYPTDSFAPDVSDIERIEAV